MKTQYYSFLLRIWRSDHGQQDPSLWRASLESAETGEKISFRSMDELWSFLQRLLTEDPDKFPKE